LNCVRMDYLFSRSLLNADHAMKIRIHPVFYVYIGVNIIFSSAENCIAVLIALLMHELGHYAAAKCIGERFASVEITPFGGMMTYAPGARVSKGLRGAILASAGPIGNYLCILIVSAPYTRNVLNADLVKMLITANLVMLTLNLFPALPFDGGRILFNVGYYFVPVALLLSLLSAAGIAVGTMLLSVALYGLFAYRILNWSLVLIGIYVIICASRSRSVMLAENLITVVQERLSSIHAVTAMKLIRVSHDTRLYELLEPLQRTQACCFAYENNREELCFIDEKRILKEILLNPSAMISQITDSIVTKENTEE